jgi:hypothetical protein
MPDQERGLLRVNSTGGLLVTDYVELLEAIGSAYNGLLAIAAILDGYSEPTRLRRFATPPVWELNILPYQSISPYDLSSGAVASLIRPQDQLVLSRVRFSSPGFWEFVGLLNPLQAIRDFIDDCHRRRQDREYREASERRRLEIENDNRETEMLRRRLEVARENGVPEHHLTHLLNRLVYEPMEKIEVLYATGVIQPRPISELTDGPGEQPLEP